MGIGFDSQISSETFERRNIYHSKLDIYLSEKTEENPNFVHQLTIPSYELESIRLISEMKNYHMIRSVLLKYIRN